MRLLVKRNLHPHKFWRLTAVAMVIGHIAVATPANAGFDPPPLPTGQAPDNFTVTLSPGGTNADVSFVDNNTSEARYWVTRRDGVDGVHREVWSRECCDSGQPRAINRTHSFRDPGLNTNVVHCWKAAVTIGSPPVAGFVTDEVCKASGPPSAPTYLTVATRSPDSVVLEAVRATEREWKYKTFYRRADSTTWRSGREITPAYPLSIPTVYFSMSGLETGVEYCFMVHASNPRGDTSTGLVCARTGPAPPPPVDRLRWVVSTATTVTVRFTDRSGVEDGYYLNRYNTTNGTWTRIAHYAPLGGDTVTFTDTDLTPSMTYLYHVVAFNRNGESIRIVPAATLP
jgi:hypothetical protein